MASVNRIDSVYDVAAISAEQKQVEDLVRASIEQIKAARGQSIDFNVNTKNLSDYNTKLAELNASLAKMQQTTSAATKATAANTAATQQANGTLQQNIELRRRLQATLESYNKDQKEDLALLKAGTITRAEYNKRLTESQVKIAVYKTKIQELNRVIKEDIALEGRAGDAYKQLSAEYNRAALAAKNYQITLGKNNPITIAAVANAKNLSNQLKEVDNNVGQNTRNVGNYGSALNKLLGPIRTAANILPGLGISGIFLGLGTAIASLATYLANLNTQLNNTAKFTKIKNEVQLESIKNSAAEITTLDGLVAIAKNENNTREDRNLAIKQLQDEYPAYLKNISLETINSREATEAIDALRNAVLQKAVADAYATKIAAASIKKAELDQKVAKEFQKDLDDAAAFNLKLQQARAKGDKAAESALLRYGRLTDITAKNTHTYNKEIKDTNDELDFLKKNYDAALLASLKFTTKQEKEGKTKTKKDTSAEQARRAEFEILKANLELAKEYDLRRAADEKKSFEERVSNIINYGADSQRLIEAQAAFELGAANLTAKEREKIENDKANALIRLSTELGEKLSKITADSFKVDTAALGASIKGMTDSVAKAIKKYQDDLAKMQEAARKAAAELKKEMTSALTTLSTELQGLFFDVFTNAIERQKNAVQDQIDLLEQQKQKDIEVANQTITNAQDRAAAITAIEATAAAKRQQLEAKQRQLDQQKARFEKARVIAEIIQSTSLAVVNALTQVKTLGPGAIALAALIGTIGAVQIARALATPIPRYKDGTESHPGGLAVVGDGGRSEGVLLPDGTAYKTPAVDTVVDLPKGTKVFADYSDMTRKPVFTVETKDTTAELQRGFSQVVGAIKKIPQPIIRADRAWTQAHKTGSNFRTYLNRSI